MHPTRNDLPENVRRQVTDHLSLALADAIHLHLQAKEAHWNVKGPNFFALHELFDKVAAMAREFSDELAERITALGGIAEGGPAVLVKRSTLPPNSASAARGREHVTAIANSLAQFATKSREGIGKTAEWGDAGTSDLYTEIVREVDKHLWLVEAHLQGEW